MTVETLGIDIAKNVFQLHGVKNARIIWAVLQTGEPYRAAF